MCQESSNRTDSFKLLSDKDLFERAREGDHDARWMLLHRCYPSLYCMATYHLHAGLRRRVNPSDAIMEAFVRAHRYFSRFDGGCLQELMFWLEPVLRNIIRDLHTRHTAAKRDLRSEEHNSEAVAAMFSLPAPTPPPLNEIIQVEKEQLLQKVIEELPAEQQTILRLHAQKNSLRAVAEELNMPEATCRSKWHKARKTLQKRLAEHGYAK